MFLMWSYVHVGKNRPTQFDRIVEYRSVKESGKIELPNNIIIIQNNNHVIY